jgi:nucleotide-binding universal stress UspA family protein
LGWAGVLGDMERALAVVEADETTKDLVREAGELAGAVGAGLVLVHVTREDEYEDRREELEAIPKQEAQYSIGQALQGARNFAADIGAEVLDDVDVEYEVVGRLGDVSDEVLAVADEEGCDHIFMTGQKRSPTGKAVFGDETQQVILEFDGAVTVVTA